MNALLLLLWIGPGSALAAPEAPAAPATPPAEAAPAAAPPAGAPAAGGAIPASPGGPVAAPAGAAGGASPAVPAPASPAALPAPHAGASPAAPPSGSAPPSTTAAPPWPWFLGGLGLGLLVGGAAGAGATTLLARRRPPARPPAASPEPIPPPEPPGRAVIRPTVARPTLRRPEPAAPSSAPPAAAEPPPDVVGPAPAASEPPPVEQGAVATPPLPDGGTPAPWTAEEQAWLERLGALPHGALARALAELYLRTPEAGAAFTDPALVRSVTQDLAADLSGRLQAFERVQRQAPEELRAQWVEPALVPTLDQVARLHAAAVRASLEGSGAAAALADQLADLLYQVVGPACVQAGWFALLEVHPYDTPFDTRLHHAVESRPARGYEGRVLEVRRVGRLDARSGALLQPAHVVVGG